MALGAVFCLLAVADASAQRFQEIQLPPQGRTGLTLLGPEATGLNFTNGLPEERQLANQILLNGSGVAAGDVDGDGRCDLFFAGLGGQSALFRNLGQWHFTNITAAAGLGGLASLDATGAGLADVDGDGSLDLVVNSMGGGTHIFFNDGRGHFQEAAANAGLNAGHGGTSLALADIDGNGSLDLYVANYRTETIRDSPNTGFTFRMVNGQPQVYQVNGRPITDPDLAHRFSFRFALAGAGGKFGYEENGEPDALFRNDGHGHFTAVSWTNGAFLTDQGQALAEPLYDWGLSVMCRDLNGDGAPDIYVCNDFHSPDRVWLNDGHGHFRPMPQLALRQTALSSMGVDVADLDRDGWDDIFTLDMLSRQHSYRLTQHLDLRPEIPPFGVIEFRPQYSRNALFLNRGDGTYAQVAQYAGLEASEWSWMPVFLDLDLDGYEDVLIPTGYERDNMNMDIVREIEQLKKERRLSPLEQTRLRRRFPRLDTGKLAFRNTGHLKFEDKSAEWGFNQRGVSQGLALADLDNDGDLDVVVNNLNGVASVYRNETIAPRVAVRLKGLPPNTRGIGAKIRVLGGPVPQSQEIISGGRYLSSDDPMRVFAAGAANARLTLEVTWRSGRRTVISEAKPNRIYELEELANEAPGSPLDRKMLKGPPLSPRVAGGEGGDKAGPPGLLPHFRDVSPLLGHTHHQEPFDDFARQPMLSRQLSQSGPGLCWFDLDGDGRDDLIIGSGRGGAMGVFRNDGHGGFEPLAEPWLNGAAGRAQTTILGWRDHGRTSLLAGLASYEDGQTNGTMVGRFDFSAKTLSELVADAPSSCGPLALADLDADGQLDLFVGGRVVPGRYGEPAVSQLFRGQPDGTFVLDGPNTRQLAEAGMVSGAVFSDLDGDGYPDLILACEWGPLRIFHNDHGTLSTWDWKLSSVSQRTTNHEPRTTLSSLTGWWNGVAVGDFDGDGRQDIVASNWGQNTPWEHYRQPDLHLFCGDVDDNGTVDLIEAYTPRELGKLAPMQPFHLVRQALPLIAERMATCGRYASLGLEEIYGAALKPLRHLQANCLETTLFLNRGDHFEVRPLPAEAQFAPAFAVVVGDLDGDGQEDLFLGQNFCGVPPETPRCDAGRGLWLRGDGHGGFSPVPGARSGLLIYGEQRGAALCDFDGDGRVDLAVSQNANATKLYQNVGARPGLRVKLKGPPGNPAGIGAVLWLGFGQKQGPAREIHAGSGYWSQDSAVAVMATPQPPTHVWVRWPGGKVTSRAVVPGAGEVTVQE